MESLASLNFSTLKKLTENKKKGIVRYGSDENKQCKQNMNKNFSGKNFS